MSWMDYQILWKDCKQEDWVISFMSDVSLCGVVCGAIDFGTKMPLKSPLSPGGTEFGRSRQGVYKLGQKMATQLVLSVELFSRKIVSSKRSDKKAMGWENKERHQVLLVTVSEHSIIVSFCSHSDSFMNLYSCRNCDYVENSRKTLDIPSSYPQSLQPRTFQGIFRHTVVMIGIRFMWMPSEQGWKVLAQLVTIHDKSGCDRHTRSISIEAVKAAPYGIEFCPWMEVYIIDTDDHEEGR